MSGSPTRNALRPAKLLYTGKESGVAQGDGFSIYSEALSLSDSADDLLLERRVVFDESFTLSDELVGRDATDAVQERLSHSEVKLAFLNSTAASGPERPVQTPVGTLTADFGRGGFGQLGVGGSVSVTG